MTTAPSGEGIVIDASAFAEFLLGTDLGHAAAEHSTRAVEVHAPNLIVVEVTSVLRAGSSGGYNAAYAALAASLDVPLVTSDGPLERALQGSDVTVELITTAS